MGIAVATMVMSRAAMKSESLKVRQRVSERVDIFSRRRSPLRALMASSRLYVQRARPR